MKRKIIFASLIFMLLTTAAFGQKGYPRHDLQVINEWGRILTDVTSIKICTSNTTTAQTIYQDAYLATAVTNPITTVSSNTTLNQASGSCYWYGTDAYDVIIISTLYGTISAKGLTSSTSRFIFPTYWAASQSQTSTDAQSFTLGTDSDWVIAGGATADRLTFTPATDGATVYIGNATRQADTTIWSGSGSTYWLFSQTNNALDFIGADALFDDASKAYFGTDSDWYAKSSTAKTLDLIPGSTTDETAIVNIGADTAGADLKLFAATTGDYVLFDASAGSLEAEDVTISLGDGTKILFGDALGTGDLSLSSTTNVLSLAQVVSGTGEFYLGVDGKGIDTTFFGETASSYMKWDQDAGTNGELLLDAANIALGDGDKLLFGDTLGTGDFSISDETDVLSFRQIVADTGTVAWGADNAGIDQTWYGESASAYMKYDATGADQLQLVGVDSSGTLLAITGVDTSGNSDSVTIAHSGTGDGIQITDSTATAVALHTIAAANQTTTMVNLDGATGNWIGADDVGMLTVIGDTAGAHTGATLLRVVNSAQPIASAEGFLARFVDTGTARTTAHAVEIESTNTTPALGLNNQLTITGADSTGVLMSITGIDTTGNSDSVQIAHSGTGDGLQITCTEADSVAENLVAATSQTTSVLKVDGTTGSWLGAANVGMVNLTNDGALADVAASLLYINNTGVPTNDSRGSSLRIVDTGNAAAGTAGYAVYVSATDATVEAMLVDDGDVNVHEDVIVGGYVLNTATAGTKVMAGCPITIEFRPTAAETLTWAVPDGYDLVITDAWGYKIAAAGAHGDDDIQIQNNDGSAADVFTEEELNGVTDTTRFQFDGLIDTQNEIEDTSTLDCVANEGTSVDCIVVVTGYLKTAD